MATIFKNKKTGEYFKEINLKYGGDLYIKDFINTNKIKDAFIHYSDKELWISTMISISNRYEYLDFKNELKLNRKLKLEKLNKI